MQYFVVNVNSAYVLVFYRCREARVPNNFGFCNRHRGTTQNSGPAAAVPVSTEPAETVDEKLLAAAAQAAVENAASQDDEEDSDEHDNEEDKDEGDSEGEGKEPTADAAGGEDGAKSKKGCCSIM